MRYPGGKGKCYQRLINLMPPHQTYIESHLGGGAVMRNKKAAQRNIGLDLDDKVIALWQAQHAHICELHQVDAIAFLEGYTFEGQELVYVDPLISLRRAAEPRSIAVTTRKKITCACCGAWPPYLAK